MKPHFGKRRGTKRKLGPIKHRKVTVCEHPPEKISYSLYCDRWECECGSTYGLQQQRLELPWSPTYR